MKFLRASLSFSLLSLAGSVSRKESNLHCDALPLESNSTQSVRATKDTETFQAASLSSSLLISPLSLCVKVSDQRVCDATHGAANARLLRTEKTKQRAWKRRKACSTQKYGPFLLRALLYPHQNAPLRRATRHVTPSQMSTMRRRRAEEMGTEGREEAKTKKAWLLFFRSLSTSSLSLSSLSLPLARTLLSQNDVALCRAASSNPGADDSGRKKARRRKGLLWAHAGPLLATFLPPRSARYVRVYDALNSARVRRVFKAFTKNKFSKRKAFFHIFHSPCAFSPSLPSYPPCVPLYTASQCRLATS